MRWQELRERLDADPEHTEALKQQIPYRHLALAVAQIRAAHDLTQTEFAARVGTTQSVIARLESGRHAPNVRLLDRIAAAFEWELQVSFAPRPPAEVPGIVIGGRRPVAGLEHLLNLSLAAAAEAIVPGPRPRRGDTVSSTFYLSDNTVVRTRPATEWSRPVTAVDHTAEGRRDRALAS